MSEPLAKSTDQPVIAATRVEGVTVYDARGEKLGVVRDVFIDKQSGQAQFVSVATGGLLGVGESQYPMPWDWLTYDEALKGFSVGLHPDEMSAGPRYAGAEPLADAGEWMREVNAYYLGLPPTLPGGGVRPRPGRGRHFTHGSGGAAADLAVAAGMTPEDRALDTPHSRRTEPPAEAEMVDQLAEKLEQAENRQEALLDEGVEESFPASDPVSVKHIT
jgi:sporulation protein YlmC with PRC-barrel domain